MGSRTATTTVMTDVHPVPVAPPGLAAQSQEAQSAAEFTHLCTTFGDCIESLPPTLTRSISDLRELDAVLSGSISTITDQLNELLKMLEDPSVTPEQRFHHLRRLADEAKDFRLGGEDKIRVATGTCETLIHHTNQLDVLAGLLSTLLPGSMAGTIPPPSWPHGYPVLFPTQASASGSSYRKPDFLPSSQQPYGGVRQAGLHHNPSALGYTLDSGYYTTRQADMYALAANNVRNYVREGAQLPEENRIKQHIKKQRQDASLQLGGRAKASNANSHMPTSEHKNRGGRPVPNPGLAGYPSLSSYGATAGGSSSLMAPSLSMGTSASTQGPMISSGSLLQSTGHSVNGVELANHASGPANGNSVQPAKKRRTSQKDKQASQSDYGDATAVEANDEYVPPPSLARDRQNSGRGGGAQSPVVPHGNGAGGKRSRNNSNKKAGMDSPDLSSAYPPTGANSNGKTTPVATSFAAPLKRKGSQIVDITEDIVADGDAAQRAPSRAAAIPAAPTLSASAPTTSVPALVHDDAGAATASEAEPVDLDGDLEMIGDDGEDGAGDDGGDDRTYCYCNRVSFGNMIGCDGDDCQREWFHLACLHMSDPPKGEWFCDECQEKRTRDFNLNKKKR